MVLYTQIKGNDLIEKLRNNPRGNLINGPEEITGMIKEEIRTGMIKEEIRKEKTKPDDQEIKEHDEIQ